MIRMTLWSYTTLTDVAETREFLMEQWDYMYEHNTLKATLSSNAQLAALVLKARGQHGPEEMPQALYLRSALIAAGFFRPGG